MEKDDMVNIPRDVEDIHYRYKMPSLFVKIEGRGNGIKTRLTNILAISRALDRSPAYLVKFFGFELGAQVILPPADSDKGDFFVNGKHDSSDLARLLDRFIEKYVLCGKCRNPETTIMVKKDTPRMKCKACGSMTIGDVSHKIANYISKFPPIDPNAKKEPLDDEFFYDTKIISTDELENDWAVSLEPEAIAKRQLELCGGKTSLLLEQNIKLESESLLEPAKIKLIISPVIHKITPTANPLPILEEYWKTCPKDAEAIFNIEKVSMMCNWTEEDVIKNLFGSMWLNFKPEGAILKAHYLSLFVESKDRRQKHVLKFMEKMATESKAFALCFCDILALFWQERVLEEDIIKKWYAHPNPKTPPKVSKFIRDRSEKVIKWLDQPEEEELLPINR